MKRISTYILCAAMAATGALQAQSTTSISVDAGNPGHKISPLLWGVFFEDINLSADGGIYAEMIRNRSLEDTDQPDHWSLVNRNGGGGKLSVCLQNPAAADLTRTKNRRSLRLDVTQAGPDAPVGVANEGYWGIAVNQGSSYKLSFVARCGNGLKGGLKIALENAEGKTIAQASVKKLGQDWKEYKFNLVSTQTDKRARLVFFVTDKGTLWLDKISLFPKETWKGHGLRPDLAQTLLDLKPAFVRFPGGCWVEGDTMREAYRWKETVGDIWERRTQWNIWQYWATHGLGYHEYLQMCEDLKAEPLFVINCGMSHRENIPMNQMGPFIQDALDAIEYANGPVTSRWGAMRAKNGHPASFKMKYLEIGNENGGPAYHERYAIMYKAVKERHPEMIIIANDWQGIPKNAPVEVVDEHYYNNPEFFIRQAERYDKYERKGPKIYVGEYAVTQGCGKGNLRGAVGEAAFMIGMERNSDVVALSSYAPLFVHLNHRKWNPDLINFDNAGVYGIPSFYAQKMFAQNRGDVILPTQVETTMTAEEPKGGAVGIGTWLTQAEFKDIKVTRGDETLFAYDPAKGINGGRQMGAGQWSVANGVISQSARQENVRLVFGDKNWKDYTLTLKARKTGGDEGFLVLFGVQDDQAKSWWNLGGWGNKRHGIEAGGTMGSEVAGSIQTGKWYDIRIECYGKSIKCYLDGKLIHDAAYPAMKAIYASASFDQATKDTILKVVNVASEPQTAEIKLNGNKTVVGPISLEELTAESSTAENSLENPRKVAPATKTLPGSGAVIRHAFPGNSINVLRFKTQ